MQMDYQLTKDNIMIKRILFLGIFFPIITFTYSQEDKTNYLPTDYSHPTDSILLKEIMLNGSRFPTTTDEVITLFGKPDRKVEFESDIDRGAYSLSLNYGCSSFEECKIKKEEITGFGFLRFEDYQNGRYLFNNFAFSNPAIRLTVKNQDIFIGDGVERLKELFPESYRFYQYKIDEDITDRGSYVGVYILNEYKQLVFQIDEKSKEICRISIFPTE